MSSKTNHFEQEILKFLFLQQPLTIGTSLWAGLSSAQASEVGSEYGNAEVADYDDPDKNYSRVEVPLTAAKWEIESGSTVNGDVTTHTLTILNKEAIQWPTAGTEGWNAVNSVVFFDAQEGGSALFAGSVDGKTVAENDTLSISPRAFAISENLVTGLKSKYLAEQLYRHIFTGATWTYPDNIYFGLLRQIGGTGGVEVETIHEGTYVELDPDVHTGYARTGAPDGATPTVLDTSDWEWVDEGNPEAPLAGRMRNIKDIQWPAAEASWESVNGIIMCDAPTDGNVWFWTNMAPKTINLGDRLAIPRESFILIEN